MAEKTPLRLNNLSPAKGSTKNRKRLGRGPGSGQGKTAGRGNKGFWSRSGSSQKRGFEGGQMPLHRRVPKRGFTNIFREEYLVVNVDDLEARFEKGATVDPEALRKSRLVRKAQGKVKLLGRGEVTRALTVKVHAASADAKKKIEAAGGKVELL
ncbi:MAG: 50S ribosomal protein L15 [Acidobacteria bacterium]|nr:50S ribosomal protein L15 [Acidobacteriota bacterium]